MKVLLATPVKGPVDVSYLHGVVHTVMNDTGHEIIPSVSVSTYVNFARNNLAEEALERNCDRILFVDSDMDFGAPHVKRILSHDVDVVGAQYCKRVGGEPQWLGEVTPGAVAGADGLIDAKYVPTGFMAIKTHTLRQLKPFIRRRRYAGIGGNHTEFFPISLTMEEDWRHPAEVLVDEVTKIAYSDFSPEFMIRDIRRTLEKSRPLPQLVGEDIGWCRIARAAGVKLHLDCALVLRHMGTIGFPAEEKST